MDRERFWDLVQAVNVTSENGCDELTERLANLPPDEIVAFDRTLWELMASAYRWDLWGAAYVINGGCSDDGFDYFRAWLVAQGRTVYERALEDPDSLAPYAVADECECEELLYGAHEAYQARTGEPLPVGERVQPAGPAGELWDFDDADEMRRRYPRICASVDY